MRQYGLIGYPLGHSFSADFFTQLFEREGIDARYTPYELREISGVSALLQTEQNLCGLNVTSPYKEVALRYATTLSPEVVAVGAANVLHIKRDASGAIASISAHNTDIIGFRQSLLPHLSLVQERQALILGTGGAAKACAYALGSLGIDAIFVSRSAGEGAIGYDQIEQYLPSSRLIVQATPVGLHSGALVRFPYHCLRAEHLCYDLIYNPEQTPFLYESKRHGAMTKNGLEMLHLQALAAWDIWQTP